MSPSRKQRSRAIASFLATAAAVATAAPGAFAATTVTYNTGGTSPGMNVTDDPGNAVHLVITSGTQNNHVGVRSSNGLPLTPGDRCAAVSATEVTCFASGPRIVTADLGDGDDRLGYCPAAVTARSSAAARATTPSTAPIGRLARRRARRRQSRGRQPRKTSSRADPATTCSRTTTSRPATTSRTGAMATTSSSGPAIPGTTSTAAARGSTSSTSRRLRGGQGQPRWRGQRRPVGRDGQCRRGPREPQGRPRQRHARGR